MTIRGQNKQTDSKRNRLLLPGHHKWALGQDPLESVCHAQGSIVKEFILEYGKFRWVLCVGEGGRGVVVRKYVAKGKVVLLLFPQCILISI